MLIVGAKGFAQEVLEVLHQNANLDKICFFDDVTEFQSTTLFNIFPILTTITEAKDYFKNVRPVFTLGIGGPKTRMKLYHKMVKIGGQSPTLISPYARLGHYGNKIEEACNIMTGTIITNSISIGKGCLINLNCTIGHDSKIGNFVEMAPGVHVSGNSKIGNYCNLGTNATLLPHIELGENVVVGAGAVVTSNFESNSLIVGVPARKIKNLPPINL